MSHLLPRLYDTAEERALVDLIADPMRAPILNVTQSTLIRRAREHGVEGVLPAGIEEHAHAPRVLAHQMQHEARLLEVASIGRAFARAGLSALVLKGVALAERYYDPPFFRGSTDIDLLVLPESLSRASDALSTLGYSVEGGARGHFFRERHFHLHVDAPGKTPLELHFLAYRGFGHEITARDLFEGSEPIAHLGEGLRVAAPARELVYLAVHAAAHRFQRMGWLLDLVLILRERGTRDLPSARAFAREVGFLRPFEATLAILHDRFGVNVDDDADALSTIALSLAAEPSSPTLRSASRFLYTLLLCEGPVARARYTTRAALDKILMKGL